MVVVESMTGFSDAENLETCLERKELNKYSVKALNAPATVEDCRRYTKFLHSSFLKSATDFLTGAHKYHQTAQVNSTH